MAARPAWRGQIRLALVSIPVEIYPATKAGAQIEFHQVHEPSGKRIKYEKVVPGIGPVDRDEIVKGYEVSKGDYVLLDPEEIEKRQAGEPQDARPRSSSSTSTTSTRSISTSPIMSSPPTTSPRKPSSCCATRCKRREEGRHRPAGDARPGICRRLKPCGRGMVLETLRYADEVNKASGYFRDIGDTKPDPDLLDMADDADREERPASSTPSEFHNRYVDALKELIAEKQKKKGEQVIQDPDADRAAARARTSST